MKLAILAAVGTLILTSCHDEPNKRYQIVETQHDLLKLDTDTGTTWRLIRSGDGHDVWNQIRNLPVSVTTDQLANETFPTNEH